MSYSLTWLPLVLQAAGLKVAECDGWEDRGRGDVGNIIGVICHHTANPDKIHNMPTLYALINGRTDPTPLAGPLSQLGLGRDGTFYIVAAGRANHAGQGSWNGINTGNTNFIGIEAENTGGSDDTPWPPVQLDAYHRGVAAILQHIGKSAQNCIGHKEWAPTRKSDPDFDMVAFRAAVLTILSGSAPLPVLIPAKEPTPSGRPTLRRGLTNDPQQVKLLQAKLSISADGIFGGDTEAAVRTFQRQYNLVPDGIVGPNTWHVLDTLP